jgi:hypothetical protein
MNYNLENEPCPPCPPCPLCGGDMHLMLMGGGSFAHCGEHGGAIICGTCNTCTSLEPTPHRVAECQKRREVWETHVLPLLKSMRHP